MQDVRTNPVVKRRTDRDVGRYLTALIAQIRAMPNGWSLSGHRVKRRRVELGTEIVITTARANRSLMLVLDSLDAEPSWKARVALRPTPGRNGEVQACMSLDSFAYLLDKAIASDPGHYLRPPTAIKDHDQ